MLIQHHKLGSGSESRCVGVVWPAGPHVSAEMYTRAVMTVCCLMTRRINRIHRACIVVLMLLLSAGIEHNPGPSSQLRFSILNERSTVNKAAHIHDVVARLRLDVLVLTET